MTGEPDGAARIVPLDIVWFKRDVRLHDHGPLATVAPRNDRRVILLYCYEPDQLAEATVHGSHIRFVHEGLLDLDKRIRALVSGKSSHDCTTTNEFQVLTVCHGEIVETLNSIHEHYAPIARLLGHQETGHMASFERDKRMRRWCKQRKIPFIELQQMGVTRCLSDRDDFSAKLKQFLNRSQHSTPSRFLCPIISDLPISILPGLTKKPLCEELTEIPIQHRGDRSDRQTGGETNAVAVLDTFLSTRGVRFSENISSPNSSWTSCSRLSPYLAWGQISLRYVYQTTQKRQSHVKDHKKMGSQVDPHWARSLAAFQSRLHWRSHFIQKLETEPEMEKRDLCSAYQHLRRQPGDWNEHFYTSWSTGTTGFPFVDACMRSLHQHGWLNFRMRAMLVSFATYNLWLDWKRLAPHLARVFLDYEPGIHYPQLQMQSGTTGINAMRVYNVTKQGKDQDPEGTFIRKYVPELSRIPNHYIHEPWKMTTSEQTKYGVVIGEDYPAPIVDEQATAKAAKQRVAEVRKSDSAKREADQVYQKHGSRTRSRDNDMAKSTTPKKRAKQRTLNNGQLKISGMFAAAEKSSRSNTVAGTATTVSKKSLSPNPIKSWSCHACTFLNEKQFALACSICGTERKR